MKNFSPVDSYILLRSLIHARGGDEERGGGGGGGGCELLRKAVSPVWVS